MSFQARGSQSISGAPTSQALALRTHPLVFGVVVFLSSELMFFGGLIAAYFNLKTINAAWPPPGARLDTGEALIGTAMLAASSFTMLLTTRYISRKGYLAARFWLGITILLASAFECIAVNGWLKAPFTISSHAYGTVFFALTGFHFAHVLAGIIMLIILFFAMRASAFERDARAAVEAIGFYWHFVFAVWLFIWGTIYYVR